MFNGHGLSVASCIFLLVPVEIGSCWIGSVSALTPLASICNLLSIMVNEHIQQAAEGEFSFRDRTAITSNIGGVAICRRHGSVLFWGLGMTLALEDSMEDRTQFPSLLAQAFTGIGIVYASLGFFGYMAYGDQTRDIVTLNLPQTWSSKGLQIGLCMGLVFAFPIMLHPINEIIEGNLTKIHLQEWENWEYT